MSASICGISSMAPRQVLAELVDAYTALSGQTVRFEAAGGVDVAKRVESGERFDVVVLASDAIEALMAHGHFINGSRVDLVRSGVAVAVGRGQPHPDIGSEAAVREAVLDAETVAYSTGPSGRALAALFARWGIADRIADRVVTPPPGVPVGSLVAQGQVALGFQQLSELIHIEGIDVLGPLPPEIQIDTIFSAAIGARTEQAPAVHELLAFLVSPQADDAKRRQGMAPA